MVYFNVGPRFVLTKIEVAFNRLFREVLHMLDVKCIDCARLNSVNGI